MTGRAGNTQKGEPETFRVCWLAGGAAGFPLIFPGSGVFLAFGPERNETFPCNGSGIHSFAPPSDGMGQRTDKCWPRGVAEPAASRYIHVLERARKIHGLGIMIVNESLCILRRHAGVVVLKGGGGVVGPLHHNPAANAAAFEAFSRGNAKVSVVVTEAASLRGLREDRPVSTAGPACCLIGQVPGACF